MKQFACVADLSQSANCYRTPVWLCALSPGWLSAMRKHRQHLLPAAGAQPFLTRQKSGSLPSGEGQDGGGRCWESSELAGGTCCGGRCCWGGLRFASLPGPSAWAAPFKKGCRTHNQTNRQSSACVLAWQDGFPPGNAKYFI